MSGILKLRDKDGNFFDIPVITGKDGKSAYEQAVEGGYQGTEEDFIAFLNGLTGAALSEASLNEEEANDHYENFNNPHNVTAQQTGALPTTGGTLSGDVNMFGDYYPTLKVGRNAADTSSILYTPNKTVDIYNWANGQPTALSLGNYNSMLLRDVFKLWVGAQDYQIYGDHNAAELGVARVATGSYVGTGTSGASNPVVLTFPVQPKVVYISITGNETRCDATLPWMYGSRIGLVYSSTSSNWSTHTTYPVNLVWEGNTLSFTYTLSTTSADQRQLNIEGATYDWAIWY